MFASLSAPAKKNLLILALAIAAGGGYLYYRHSAATAVGETRYVLGAVEKTSIITTVSGGGQVAASDKLDIKAKASGTLTSLSAVAGQKVAAGKVLATIDSADAYKAVRDAEISLETAELSLQKLQQPPDDLSTLQSDNSLAQAKESREKAGTDLENSFTDGYTTVADAFLDLPGVMTGLQDLLYGNSVNGSQANIDAYSDAAYRYDAKAYTYRDELIAAYAAARTAYDSTTLKYKMSSRSSSEADIEALIGESSSTVGYIATAVKDATNLVQFYQDQLTERNLKPAALSNTHLSSLSSYTSTSNRLLSSLLSASRAIDNARSAIVNADRTVAERTGSNANLKKGPDALDLRSSQITVDQRKAALADARNALADYVVRAPFDGLVSAVPVKKGDNASNGTTVATLITEQSIATITLNEIDAAKVQLGQKATLTFDAIDGLTISGKVAMIDQVGTVTQGVVNYGLTVSFDTQDDRVKPGMTVTAAIVTSVKQDVLAVPNSAVKSQGDASYVEVIEGASASSSAGIVSDTPPTRKTVEIGAANDDMTEILSGLSEGDIIVTRTITATAKPAAAASTQTRSLIGGSAGGGGNATFRATGGGGFGGGR